MAVAEQTQVRCANCHRRLADFENEIRSGYLVLEIRCEKCGKLHTEKVTYLSS